MRANVDQVVREYRRARATGIITPVIVIEVIGPENGGVRDVTVEAVELRAMAWVLDRPADAEDLWDTPAGWFNVLVFCGSTAHRHRVTIPVDGPSLTLNTESVH